MTTYQLVTNSVSPSHVRETDDAYVIEDVPFIRNMTLAGGYVPAESIAETIGQWEGAPATLNHPRNARGEPIAANRKPETHLGILENPQWDGETGRVDVVVRKGRLDAVEGADSVQSALESGDPLDVSSQYAARNLPPGEYDGEMRENVEAIARPDSLALLPDKQGRCSIEDGCGIDPELVANAEVHVPMTRNAQHGEDMDTADSPIFETGDLVKWSWLGDTAHGRVAEVFVDEGEITRTFDGTEVSQDSDEAPVYLVDVWRGDDYSGQALRQQGERDLSAWSDPPDGAMSANVFERIGRRVADAIDLTAPTQTANSDATTPAESGTDTSGTESDDSDPSDDSGSDMERDKLINEITANSAISAASLEDACDERVELLHADVMEANDADADIGERLDRIEDQMVTEDQLEDVVADAQTDDKKDDLARDIVANSAEYDDPHAVREDFPTETALETKLDQVTDDGGVPGADFAANIGGDNEVDRIADEYDLIAGGGD